MNHEFVPIPIGWWFSASARTSVLALWVFGLILVGGGSAVGQTDPNELARLTSTLRQYAGPLPGRANPDEPVRIAFNPEGHLRHLGAPPAHAFQPETIVRDQPEETARLFLINNRILLGFTSRLVGYQLVNTRSTPRRHHLRLQQTYRGIPIFAAQASVQMNDQLGIEFLIADLAGEVNTLDDDPGWITPAISRSDATTMASRQVRAEQPGVVFSISAPQLEIFAPSVLGTAEEMQLTWRMEVSSQDYPTLNAIWFVDARTGRTIRRYATTHSALDRQIFDANNADNLPGTLVRSEGDPPSGIPDADNTYAFLADIHNFYLTNHGRDSFDDDGAAISVTVRRANSSGAPWLQAVWNSGTDRMLIGFGLALDDVVAHEFTHGVTRHTSDLVYENASGAINESMSDVFGEFVDLSNGVGNDSPGVRWDMAEDFAGYLGTPGGRFRSMSQPIVNRRNSPNYVSHIESGSGTTGNDFGGVHSNSGVNNKLCYLLTDGDTFNGQTVTGMGLIRVASLYYEVNANLLSPGADWDDLFYALLQASVNLGWTTEERNNLVRACLAVEIAYADNRYVDWTTGPCSTIRNGAQTCTSYQGTPFLNVTQGVLLSFPGDRLIMRGGNYPESITINKVMTLRSYLGPAVIGTPLGN